MSGEQENEAMETIGQELSISDLAKEVGRAFPDLKCLRCGGEKFHLSRQSVMGQILPKDDGSASIEGGHLDTFALVCRRCGFVEQHLVKIFVDAIKPIPIGD